MDFAELEKVTPSNLAKVASEEEVVKKSASKQRKKSKRKAISEKPPSECPLEPSLLPVGLSTEVGPEAIDSTLISSDQLVNVDFVAPKSRVDIDV